MDLMGGDDGEKACRSERVNQTGTPSVTGCGAYMKGIVINEKRGPYEGRSGYKLSRCRRERALRMGTGEEGALEFASVSFR